MKYDVTKNVHLFQECTIFSTFLEKKCTVYVQRMYTYFITGSQFPIVLTVHSYVS